METAETVKTPRRTPEQLAVHRVKQREYVARNRSTVNGKMREYSSRPEVKSRRREYYRENSIAMLLSEARKRARQKDLTFSLAIADIEIPAVCPVLGIPLIFGGDRRGWPSLDRRDNSLGYVPGNVFVISHRANKLKSDANADEVERILAYMRESL